MAKGLSETGVHAYSTVEWGTEQWPLGTSQEWPILEVLIHNVVPRTVQNIGTPWYIDSRQLGGTGVETRCKLGKGLQKM